MVSVSKTAAFSSMLSVAELLLAGNRVASEADSEVVDTPRPCLHVLLAVQVGLLLPLDLVETSVADSVAALGVAIVEVSEVDSVAAIVADMAVEEGESGTKEEEEALEVVGEVAMVAHPMAMVAHPMASVMVQHLLLTHLPVQVGQEPVADSLVGMAVAATADHQLTAA